MTLATRLLLTLPILAQAACLDPTAVIERQLDRTFEVASGSVVRVELSGGSVHAVTGPAGRVHVLLRQAIHTNEGEREAERLLADFEISATQQGDEVSVLGRRTRGSGWGWHMDRVRITATITVPPDVRLELGTSGGSIAVRGERAAAMRADTSGGSIAADGGSGDLMLTTSGGSITVGRALGRLLADTSGGSISVDYVGASAHDIDLDTSGGGIRVGIDPAASLAVSAGTSGGSVRIEGLTLDGRSIGRSHASGTINGGAGRLDASTSGGSIRLRAAADPGLPGQPAAVERSTRR
jgi:hypothetical protein